jgi:hypothetical protein
MAAQRRGRPATRSTSLASVGRRSATTSSAASFRTRARPLWRAVLPEYAPSSYYVGSRAAAVASRGLGCPGRAQERRGRTREAPGSAGDASIRPVVRTLRVGRRNHGPRRPRSGHEGLGRATKASVGPRRPRSAPMPSSCAARGQVLRDGWTASPPPIFIASRSFFSWVPYGSADAMS